MNRPNIVIVDDDPGALQLLARIVGHLGEVFVATNGADALRLVPECDADLILLDADMPGLSGLEVCQRLKANPATADIPVIMITANDATEFEVSGFANGVADFAVKPVVPPIVQARVRTQLELRQAMKQLRELARTDSLTGLANRRHFDETLTRDMRMAQRAGTSLAVLMVDVDHFKRYNDQHGHVHGDECLRLLAAALSAACKRPGDFAARYGGEEFAIVLPDTDAAGAVTIGEAMLRDIAQLALPHGAPDAGACVSVSIGAAVLPAVPDPLVESSLRSQTGGARDPARPDRCSAQALVRAADAALYRAKQRGRNRVETAALGNDPAPDAG